MKEKMNEAEEKALRAFNGLAITEPTPEPAQIKTFPSSARQNSE